jgi:hypothetical protein
VLNFLPRRHLSTHSGIFFSHAIAMMLGTRTPLEVERYLVSERRDLRGVMCIPCLNPQGDLEQENKSSEKVLHPQMKSRRYTHMMLFVACSHTLPHTITQKNSVKKVSYFLPISDFYIRELTRFARLGWNSTRISTLSTFRSLQVRFARFYFIQMLPTHSGSVLFVWV